MFRNRSTFEDLSRPRTQINELANKPRYDIEGDKRYGNTLSDDMFAMKNPNYKGHTPESYDYFNEPFTQEINQWTPAGGFAEVMGNNQFSQENVDSSGISTMPQAKNAIEQYLLTHPQLLDSYGDFRDRAISRKKNIGEGGLDWGTYDLEWQPEDDILEAGEAYTSDQFHWAEAQRAKKELEAQINDLSTEGIREDMASQKNGWPSYHTPGDMSSRRDAEYDSYVDDVVNYNALSPATLTQLAKMGVNRPKSEDEDDASNYLNWLLKVYRDRL